MKIAIVNLSKRRNFQAAVEEAMQAIQKQLRLHFEPHWGFSATLRLLAPQRNGKPDAENFHPTLADGVIYIWDDTDLDSAYGYHSRIFDGVPYGIVSLKMCGDSTAKWQSVLSHEVLELVGNPSVNLHVPGPHPLNRRKRAFYWVEMCDPVQDSVYEIGGVTVSDFVLPAYFSMGEEKNAPTHFLGIKQAKPTLKSFGTLPGGYVIYYDLERRRTLEHNARADQDAKATLARKRTAGLGRTFRAKRG